ncbi:hypothetical protein [Paraburkholderia sp. BR10936]|uniref:hypothetical protein n=1 Tax=Paraburkholderia sp. BR10936 TaxID=3236993 RepID=UPI0034D2E8C0
MAAGDAHRRAQWPVGSIETEKWVMNDAQAFNAELDRSLECEGKVDRDTYVRFLDAYHFDAATSVSWLRSKLQILQQRLRRGEPIHLWDTAMDIQIKYTKLQEFSDWVSAHFSSIQL